MPLPAELTKTTGGLEKKVSAWVYSNPLLLVAGVLVAGTLIALVMFKPGATVTKSVKKDRQGNVLERTRTTTPEDEKNIWDWVGLLGVPIALTGFGVLQQLRSEKQVQAEKSIAESNQREEALQNYLDRLSDLLIEKNLIGKAVRLQAVGQEQTEEKEMLDAASDVIRARTLSILRRLGDDGERKGHVIQFLIEAEVTSKLKIDLSNADLSGANLRGANLSGVNLSSANLNKTDISYADLSGADLSGAKLLNANLTGSDLSKASLFNAKISNANLSLVIFSEAHLSFADLTNVNLFRIDLTNTNLTHADLTGAKNWTEDRLAKARLSKTKLPAGCNLNPNRDAK